MIGKRIKQCFLKPFSIWYGDLQKFSALRAEFFTTKRKSSIMCRLFVFVRAQREKFPFIRRVTRFSLSPEPFQMDIQEIFPNPTVPYFQFFKSNRTIFFASGPNMVRCRTIYGTKKNTGIKDRNYT